MLPDGSAYAVLHSFVMETDGDAPAAELIEGSDGALYGTSTHGGLDNGGTVFKLFPDGTGFTVLHPFVLGGGTGGDHPFAALLQAGDGAFYGTPLFGGAGGGGTVLKLLPDGTGFNVLHSFTVRSATDGANSVDKLIEGSDGYLYGTTSLGGASDAGTVFKLLPNGSGFAIVYSFTGGDDGYGPNAGVAQASDGTLYGTTTILGANGGGTLFQVSPNGTGFAVLHSFAGGDSDGSIPYGRLIQASDGNLFGTTSVGGKGSRGTLFRLNIAR